MTETRNFLDKKKFNKFITSQLKVSSTKSLHVMTDCFVGGDGEVKGREGGCVPLPGNEAISKVHNLFMFLLSRFCPSDRSKAAFPGPYRGSQRGRPNLILRSSNIPQSNITSLRSYHIQREAAIFFHHSSPLSSFPILH